MLRLILLCLVLLSASPAMATGRLTVFAAASLQESLDTIAGLWTERSGQTVVISYAASSALARQIEQGAPADVFVSADLEWMDYLQARRRIDPATRVALVRNRLVVIAPAATGPATLALAANDLRAALGPKGRLALAETTGVPAGRYARQSLEALRLWDAIAGRLAEADNVRAAMAFVARGEAPLGIVYATDAKAEPRVRVVAEIPAASHAAIVYPAARVVPAQAAQADGFLRFLSGPEARAVFERAGFECAGSDRP
jgi:molybdate transport system substrate-binding protein